ncbi:MAG: hypothetical protein OEN55_18960, partial [Alphaproteobacteria bacterium]|nr:hypothetical protein [Alphaproteobacteria bacterium]
MKRWTRIMSLALVVLAVSTCEPEREAARTSPAYELSLVDSGLRPLNEREIVALLSNATVYATFVLTEQGWIEYFDSSGAVVRTTVPQEPPGRGTGRRLLYGSWWGEGGNIC